MATVSVVNHTTHGHTRRLAESLADGARLVSGATVHILEIVPSDIHEGRWKNERNNEHSRRFRCDCVWLHDVWARRVQP
jgi:hypothetical protein